jgi:hypothetical protein
MRKLIRPFCVLIFVSANLAFAQGRLFSAWENRVRATSAQQPSWAVPIFTPSSGLVQLARTDEIRQYTSTHTTTWNYGGGKGFNLIPWYKTEIDFNVPPYIQHNTPKAIDGAGDLSFLLKYRILAANESKGAYNISAALASTAPTGSHKNGASDGTVSPTVYLGKGFGWFDVQTSAAESLPTGHTHKLGRPITWNTVAQAKVRKLFWPEVEFNSTFFRGGANDGKLQAFVSPGLMVSKIKFNSESNNRLALVFGAGEQIAVSHFHSYNHALSFTTRIVF